MKDSKLRSKAATTELLTLVGFAAVTFTVIVAAFRWTSEPGESETPARLPPASNAVKTARPAPVLPVSTDVPAIPDLAPKSVKLSTASIDLAPLPTDEKRNEPAPSSTKTPAETGKAQATEFTCLAKSANEVLLKGAFLVRTRGIQPMFEEEDGVWRTTVMLLPGTYQYYCIVDGVPSEARTIQAASPE